MNAVKRLLVVGGLVCLGLLLVFLNRGLKNSAVPDKDEDEQAQQSKAPKATPPAPVDPKTVLAPEETVGDPTKSAHKIQAGWVYDEDNQKKPETLTAAIQKIHYYVEKSGGIASAEIVDLDVPAEDRTPSAQAVTGLGISVDGVLVSSGNLSDGPFPDGPLLEALEAPPKR